MILYIYIVTYNYLSYSGYNANTFLYTSAKAYISYSMITFFFHCCSHCVCHGILTLVFIPNIN